MAELNVKVRKWGDSLAVIIPKEIADKEKIGTNDNIHIKIEKNELSGFIWYCKRENKEISTATKK